MLFQKDKVKFYLKIMILAVIRKKNCEHIKKLLCKGCLKMFQKRIKQEKIKKQNIKQKHYHFSPALIFCKECSLKIPIQVRCRISKNRVVEYTATNRELESKVYNSH